MYIIYTHVNTIYGHNWYIFCYHRAIREWGWLVICAIPPSARLNGDTANSAVVASTTVSVVVFIFSTKSAARRASTFASRRENLSRSLVRSPGVVSAAWMPADTPIKGPRIRDRPSFARRAYASRCAHSFSFAAGATRRLREMESRLRVVGKFTKNGALGDADLSRSQGLAEILGKPRKFENPLD